jgi:protein-disulfide isomerase
MQFFDYVESEKYKKIVDENDLLAKDLQLKSTPTFILHNGTIAYAIQGAQP